MWPNVLLLDSLGRLKYICQIHVINVYKSSKLNNTNKAIIYMPSITRIWPMNYCNKGYFYMQMKSLHSATISQYWKCHFSKDDQHMYKHYPLWPPCMPLMCSARCSVLSSCPLVQALGVLSSHLLLQSHYKSHIQIINIRLHTILMAQVSVSQPLNESNLIKTHVKENVEWLVTESKHLKNQSNSSWCTCGQLKYSLLSTAVFKLQIIL